MEFTSKEGYQAYNDHPGHQQFIQTRWLPEVAEFMENDYVLYSEN